MRRAFLGVDVGTSSSKGVLVRPDGEIVRTVVRAHTVSRPVAGQVEMDGDLWWREFVEIAEELTAGRDHDVAAVGISGMGPCTLLVDDDDRPVRPAILYGVDTRASGQIDTLNHLLGADRILDVCGSVLSSQAVGPKIAWVRENEPDRYRRARRLYMPSSWVVHRLTGEYVLDHHSASQSLPLYDIGALAWHESWAERVAPGIQLPTLRWPGELAGVTRQALAGIAAGTPVITGTIDAWSEALSVDALGVGDLMVMYGTTMFLIATVDRRMSSRTLWGTAGVAEGSWSLAGGMSASGAITGWISTIVQAGHPELLAEAQAAGTGAHGLLMLPHFAGERTPISDALARGVVAGLTLEHTRGDLYRAALEATAYGVRHILEAMTEAGVQVERAVAVGGGTRGGLWTQVVSDVTGLSQVVPARTIGASYGAAIMAAGLEQDVCAGEWNPSRRVCDPDPTTAALHDERYRLYRDLYDSTCDVVHALASCPR